MVSLWQGDGAAAQATHAGPVYNLITMTTYV
jgi:hypothetical protein